MIDYLARQLAEIRGEIAELKRGRVTHRAAQVLTADPDSATFTAALPDGQNISGLTAPPQFLPAVGEQVMLRLEGGTPIYEPAGIAEGAVTGREIAPGAVTVDQLAFDINDYTGGTQIFYGPDTPTATAPGDLWLKELAAGPPPEYETRRWDGNGWVLLHDQTATQALAEAVAAHEAASQAGIDALAAQGTADDAAGTALTAQQTAEAAANTAAGKTTTFRQADQPATTGRTVGDEWIETGQGNRRHIWSGSAWTLTQIGAGGISATARQLGAITVYRQTAEPTTGVINGDFWIRSTDNRIHVRQSGAWVESKDTDINTALTNAATAQATADGKVRIFPQAAPPTDMTNADVGDMWIDTDDDNRLWTWSGTEWTSRRLGNGAIQPQSLIASQVIATGTISAPLLEAIMVLTTEVIAGDPDGEYSRLSSSGLAAYAVDPGDGMPVELSRYGRGWSVRNPDNGQVVASVSDVGDLSGRNLSVVDSDPDFGGVPLSARLWDKAWGLVGWAEFPPTGGWSGSTSGELPIWEVSFYAQPGRAYRFSSTPMEFAADVGEGCVFRLRRTINGSTPGPSTPMYAEHSYRNLRPDGGSASPAQFLMFTIASMTQTEQWRFHLSAVPLNGATIKMHRFGYTYWWIEDIGPLPTLVGSPTGQATAKTTVTREYAATWSRSWRAGGTSISNDNALYQGYGDSFNGRQVSAFGFPSVTSTLSGATVDKVEVYLYAEHWWNMGGGFAGLNYHGATTEPASLPASTYMKTQQYTARGQGRWVDVTAWRSQLQSGAFRGVSLAAADNSAQYYGRFSGADGGRSGRPPRLRLTYTK